MDGEACRVFSVTTSSWGALPYVRVWPDVYPSSEDALAAVRGRTTVVMHEDSYISLESELEDDIRRILTSKGYKEYERVSDSLPTEGSDNGEDTG